MYMWALYCVCGLDLVYGIEEKSTKKTIKAKDIPYTYLFLCTVISVGKFRFFFFSLRVVCFSNMLLRKLKMNKSCKYAHEMKTLRIYCHMCHVHSDFLSSTSVLCLPLPRCTYMLDLYCHIFLANTHIVTTLLARHTEKHKKSLLIIYLARIER